ncbi:MAG: hypothetical protein K0Q51_293 [Rickettsiaceae bacterium]|jgi:hypothetical protein|nr:hypothetical protein [Rickettsiaceae bacterium]
MFMKVLKTYISLIIISFILAISPAYARLATFEEAPVEFEVFNRHINVQANGQAEEIIEQQVSILNEQGRENYGTQTLYFNGDTDKIEVIEAKTIFEGREYKIEKDMIETKPLASAVQGFDQTYQILIAYPQVVKGSKLYLKYKQTTLKQPLENYFNTEFFYGMGGVWKKSQVSLKSELPFNIVVNDPNKVLDIKQASKGNIHTLDIKLSKPLYNSLINEGRNYILEDKFLTYIQLSTAKDFVQIAKELAPDYEKVVSQPLPAVYESILQEAKTAKSKYDQINIVTSKLQEKVRYMGDWRTTNGRLLPRNLEKIVASGVGDCKDYAASTTAILRKLGFKAYVALVQRGDIYLPDEKVIASLGHFNHAIVKVEDNSGKAIWIDPTNFTSMAGGIYPDIADRPALVLDLKAPLYDHIPNIDYEHAKIVHNKTISVKDKDTIAFEGSLNLKGEESLFLAGMQLNNSVQAIEEQAFLYLNDNITPRKKRIKLPDLSSRIVKDLDLSYYYETDNNNIVTNLGYGIPLEARWSRAFLAHTAEHKGALMLTTPYSINKKTLIKNAKATDLEKLNYNISSPWVNAERICVLTKDGIVINERVNLLKSYILSAELNTPRFQKLQNEIKKYCNNAVAVFEVSN